jgi:D-alanine-D-alanine ligase
VIAGVDSYRLVRSATIEINRVSSLPSRRDPTRAYGGYAGCNRSVPLWSREKRRQRGAPQARPPPGWQQGQGNSSHGRWYTTSPPVLNPISPAGINASGAATGAGTECSSRPHPVRTRREQETGNGARAGGLRVHRADKSVQICGWNYWTVKGLKDDWYELCGVAMRLAVLCNCYEIHSSQGGEPCDKFNDMDSRATIEKIRLALAGEHEIDVIEADVDAYRKLRRGNYDLVFNFSAGIEGGNRELYFPAILEMLEIPFTGSDSLTMGICFNKVVAKKILLYHGIPTPAFVATDSCVQGGFNFRFASFPWIVKPSHEGSSIGVTSASIVFDVSSATARIANISRIYRQPALVEQFIAGREFTVGIIGNARPEVLPIVEIKNDTSENGYWVWDKGGNSNNYFERPELPSSVERSIKRVGLGAFDALGCRDWARIDVRLDLENKPYVIEVNGVAGLSDRSALPFAAEQAEVSFELLMKKIVGAAIERHRACKRPGPP